MNDALTNPDFWRIKHGFDNPSALFTACYYSASPMARDEAVEGLHLFADVMEIKEACEAMMALHDAHSATCCACYWQHIVRMHEQN